MLPNELLNEILEELSPSELKNIVLASRHLWLLARPFLFSKLCMEPYAYDEDISNHMDDPDDDVCHPLVLPSADRIAAFVAKLGFFLSPAIAPHVRVLHIIAGEQTSNCVEFDEDPGTNVHELCDLLFSAVDRFVNLRKFVAHGIMFTVPALARLARLRGPLELKLSAFSFYSALGDAWVDSVRALDLHIPVSALHIGDLEEEAHLWLTLYVCDPEVLQKVHWRVNTPITGLDALVHMYSTVLPHVHSLELQVPSMTVLSRTGWSNLQQTLPGLQVLGIRSLEEYYHNEDEPLELEFLATQTALAYLRELDTNSLSSADILCAAPTIDTLRLERRYLPPDGVLSRLKNMSAHGTITTLALELCDGDHPTWAGILAHFPHLQTLEWTVSLQGARWQEVPVFLSELPAILPPSLKRLTVSYSQPCLYGSEPEEEEMAFPEDNQASLPEASELRTRLLERCPGLESISLQAQSWRVEWRQLTGIFR
ncbi:F-box domain-containing protein [Mycena indigotica]|uniref:F-box domain-containing protein n=1 Tax=Mycena indigotica TaxID=2126181 RepID=A0A8H6WBH0_9AGAR|nr:F-box domain-containing protein [Mycena indigotica]KAF7310231.1 F-box domain-containing protein [Mycena indigotica]